MMFSSSVSRGLATLSKNDPGFLDFWLYDFQGAETPQKKHAQNFKMMAELNSMPEGGPISVNN